MTASVDPEGLSPTGSRWFALRTWGRRHPMGAVLVTLALAGLANLVVYSLGRSLPAPFLPFYPAIMAGALLRGRGLGYGIGLLCMGSVTLFLVTAPGGWSPLVLALTLGLSMLVGSLVVEILSQLSNLAEALRGREAALARGTATLLRQEAQLSAALSELEALYNEAPIGLGFLDRDLRFVRINTALADMNGFSIEAHIGKSVWDLVPDLRASAEPMLRRVIDRNEVIKGVELSGETPAQPGVRRDWTEMFYPVHDRDGAVQGVGIFCEEVTEAKRARERERLLAREVDHRAKNLLTVIQAVLKLTRSTGSVEEFKAAVTGRIQSLGRVHALLAQNRWEAVELEALVRQELEPFGPAVRIEAFHCALPLQPNVAQAISMILHELATNSAKHGALSGQGGGQGHVVFACALAAPEGTEPMPPAPAAGEFRPGESEPEDPAIADTAWGDAGPEPRDAAAGQTGWVTLSWSEHDGPPVAPAEQGGFGTSLIRSAVKGLLAGELDYDLHPDGLRCTIRFPLRRPAENGTRPD
ncbi:PAS domain-containing protein [Novosphingobium flavum]|uniref:histidine kinase n=1 Tax=Novosphingobium aerophilum TaxID=2839843 RepID=A0A7X1KDG7_9SPHN|nr:HWE histidine kinase domain-containing protein [Novosphingobium aerophilum]MBC2653314.1 PAS domain-containing protein [Novosphingobium aerophilum]MBC2663422.1 PAS domain-containing protein [Novosphingobium aerophilum]